MAGAEEKDFSHVDEGIFFNPSLKICLHEESNLGPEECYSDHLTK
jgi:hypothetical protein